MEKCLEAVEESTRRVGRGQLSKWDAGRLLTAQGGFGGGAASSYVLRLRPLFDMVDGVAILRINSWATAEVELFGMTRNVGVAISGDRNPHNSEKSGWLLLFDMRTGKLLSIVQDRDMQVMRVGSVGGLCAKYMAKAGARKIGLIGSGWMARSLLMGHCLVRDIRSVKVFSPNPANRAAYCEQMKGPVGIEDITPVSTAEEAVRGADIVVSATNSIGATFDPVWVEPGAHVYCVTGAEYDERMLQKADRIAWTYPASDQYDAKADATKATGDPQKDKIEARKHGEAGYRVASWRLLEQFASKRVYLTDFIEGRAPGRNNDKEITFSPSPAAGSSTAIRFAALLPMVYEAAKRGKVGHDLPDDWFQQETETYQMYTLK